MRLIKDAQLPYPPRACTVTNRIDGDFIDFQKHIEGVRGPHHLYMKREIVEEAAELCGMVNGEQVATLRAQLDQLGAELDEMKKDLDLYASFEQRFSERNSD